MSALATPSSAHENDELFSSAIEALGGGALVLDSSLRVIAATPTAERLLGAPVPAGLHAVKLLCGDTVERPIAEALAAARPVVATVVRSRAGGPEHLVRLRAKPLRAHGRHVGWVVQLAEEESGSNHQPEDFQGMWTADLSMKHLFRLAEKVAPCDACVLIEGEMGTGKATLAQAIHSLSHHRAGPFRALNCESATPAILERMLAPSESGDGTLFLDNVAELPHDAQAELLRVLESGVVTPLDGSPPRATEARVIAATHTPLHARVEQGRFRADLSYRLGAVTLHMPPLRARHLDVRLLTDKFIAELNEQGRRRIERVAPNAQTRLEHHLWPGNVRELRVAIESAFATGEGPVLVATDLPTDVAEPLAAHETVEIPPPPSATRLGEATDEKTRIERVIERAGGDRTRAATMLGMSRTTLWRRMRALGLLGSLVGTLLLAGCGGTSRFALRPPVLRDSDDQPLARAPKMDEESDFSNTIDVTLMRPISHAFLFERSGESRNVNSLDEVPDSTWFTNRVVTPAEVERGPCVDSGPVMPLHVKSTKVGGTTLGFVATDARGQKYMMKVDELGMYGQPEISTAADAIGSRLYWAIGFNAPCNHVVAAARSDLHVDATSIEVRNTGRRLPLTEARFTEILTSATRNGDGTYRLSSSRFIDGQPVGTWRTEGTRSDDANDVIPHEDRRDLRGEKFLAAWIDHWDSRGLNSFDTFVQSPRGGHVVHYFLDFSESIGGTTARTQFREPRVGYTTVSNAPTILADTFTFGLIRRPWDDVRVDPMFPNLGMMDVAHFEPFDFAPQTPLVRWARAEPSDLAWMARRIARLDIDHVRAAVRTGKLSRPLEEARLIEILMGRREKILRASFARSSPLADVSVTELDRVCTTDLGIRTGMSKADAVSYTLVLREGAHLGVASPPAKERLGSDKLCTRLPHFAPAGAADDSADRYATLDMIRVEGETKTTLRAHFYDLGASRGFVLVGIERL